MRPAVRDPARNRHGGARGRILGLAVLAVVAGGALLLAIGLHKAGSLEGLVRRASAELARLRPHPLLVPTPLPVAGAAAAAAPDAPPVAASATPSPTALRAGPSAPLSRTPSPAARDTTVPSPESGAGRARSSSLGRSRPDPVTPPPAPQPTATPAATLQPAARLTGLAHAWQTWNNCGPATLAMHLSYFGLQISQATIAAALRPHQDDKNVSPDELAGYARSRGLHGVARVNGSDDLLKALIGAGVPVLVETWHEPQPNDGMGHYRLLVGYDDAAGEWTAYDSYDATGIVKGRPYQGIRLSYADFERNWAVFNRAYVVLYDEARAGPVEGVLGDELDDAAMWRRSLARTEGEARQRPEDPFAWFNLGSSRVAAGDYAGAAEAFDRSRRIGLPWRMLWYQFGPFRAYFEVGRFDEVVALADATIRTARHVEELYFWKGLAENALGRVEAARASWQQALALNPNYGEVRAALAATEP